MDGTSRGKLVKAGYAIYRMRDVHAVSGNGDVILQIREMSSRGDWVLYGTYPTKAARERAWKELAKGERNMMEGTIDNEEETVTEKTGGVETNEAVQIIPRSETAGPGEMGSLPQIIVPEVLTKLTDEFQRHQLLAEFEYASLKVEADTKIKGAAMRENMERLLRVMFLRETKERLVPLGLFSRWCTETGVDMHNAYREIDKLGDFKKEALLSFGKHVSFDINKIKRLLAGDMGGVLRNSQVAIQDGRLIVDGDEIEMTPEEVKFIIEARDERLLKQEETAAKEKADLEKQGKESVKAMKKAERELKRIRRDAAKAGLTEEEQAFMEKMDGVRKEFFDLMAGMSPEAVFGIPDDQKAPTAVELAAYKNVVEFMRVQVETLSKSVGA